MCQLVMNANDVLAGIGIELQTVVFRFLEAGVHLGALVVGA